MFGVFLAFLASALSSPASAQVGSPPTRFEAVPLTGTVQFGMLKIHEGANPLYELHVLSNAKGMYKFPISLRPLDVTLSDWKDFIKNGGETEPTIRYEIGGRYMPVTHDVQGTIRMVLPTEGEKDKPGLYWSLPILTGEDLFAIVNQFKNPADSKTWDLSTMDIDAAPQLSIFLPPRSLTWKPIDIPSVSQREVPKKSGWHRVLNPDCSSCPMYTWGWVGYEAVSDTTWTHTLVPEMDFPPFGELNPSNASQLCAKVEDATPENGRVQRDLCVTMTPLNLREFYAGCDSGTK